MSQARRENSLDALSVSYGLLATLAAIILLASLFIPDLQGNMGLAIAPFIVALAGWILVKLSAVFSNSQYSLAE